MLSESRNDSHSVNLCELSSLAYVIYEKMVYLSSAHGVAAFMHVACKADSLANTSRERAVR